MKSYDIKPTILAYSAEPLGVVAGETLDTTKGRMRGDGFRGVVVHERMEGVPEAISLYPERDLGKTRGVHFSYDATARVTIDHLRSWTNFNLSDKPEGRQVIRQTGLLRVELFETKELNEFITANREALQRLGLLFIQ